MNRRSFLKAAALGGAALSIPIGALSLSTNDDGTVTFGNCLEFSKNMASPDIVRELESRLRDSVYEGIQRDGYIAIPRTERLKRLLTNPRSALGSHTITIKVNARKAGAISQWFNRRHL